MKRRVEKIVWFRNGIWDLLRGITDSLERVFQPVCAAYSLTMIQVRILVEIYYYGAHSIGSLAKTVNLTGGNCSAMCKAMEKRGYLERVRDKQDERVVNLELTEQGRNTVEELEEHFQARCSGILETVKLEEIEVIQNSLCKLADILKVLEKA